MNLKELKVKRFVPSSIETDRSWSVLKLHGEDTERFLQGQTTNDLSSIQAGEGVLNSRVDRGGKIQAVFFTLKSEDSWYLVIEESTLEAIQAELEKFIIMDEVELSKSNYKPSFYTAPIKIEDSPNVFEVNLAGVPGVITFDNELETNETINQSEALLLGFPVNALSWSEGQLLTETPHHEEVISLSKGCFLGQEVVAKIINNRGPSSYMAILSFPLESSDQMVSEEGEKVGKHIQNLDDEVSLVSVSRKFAVKNRPLPIRNNDNDSLVPEYLPLFKKKNRVELSQEIFEFGTEVFKYDEENASRWFERAVAIDPQNQDACESLGVCLGRMGLYEKGISIMDDLLKINPDSVMAHTNKSLFLMKLGKIEEAEEEKSLATVAGFKQFGNEAKEKRVLEEQKKNEEAELERKKGMFLQVLEIDEDDIIANFGMGEYYFRKSNYAKAIEFLEKTLKIDSGYSRAYLFLGKSLLKENSLDRAKEIFNNGIKIATEKGELMPANEMQEHLSSI